jgi:hypothetical protein
MKERAQLDETYHRGICPWMIWDPERSGAAAAVAAGTAVAGPADPPAGPAGAPADPGR